MHHFGYSELYENLMSQEYEVEKNIYNDAITLYENESGVFEMPSRIE